MIRLVPLPPDQKARVAHLRVAAGQESFVRDGAHAAAETDPAVDLYAVEVDGAVLGMFKLDRAYAEAPRHDFAESGDLGLRGVLIDAAHQGKGLGRALLSALPDLIRARYPQVQRLVLTVNCRNDIARKAYLAAGWQQDARLYLAGDAGPQHIMWLRLGPGPG